jgi:hypothetical protein
MIKKIGTLQIHASGDGFDVSDYCEFNSWGNWFGLATLSEAETLAEWCHAFKQGKTSAGLAEWCEHRNKALPIV